MKVDLKDVETLLFTREVYVKSMKAIYKEGWTKTAEIKRNTYNKIIKLINKSKINKSETIAKEEIIN